MGTRFPAAVLAATLLALLTACAPAQDRWADRGVPVADPHEPAPAEPAASTVDGVGGISAALVQQVVAGGGLVRPTRVHCASRTIVSRFTCDITYLDEVVTDTVTTEPEGLQLYTWEAEPDARLATAAGIHAALWREYATRASAIRCDELPEVQRVPPGQPLAQHCWFKPTVEDQAYGSGSSNRTRTVQVDIAITASGIDLREVTQES